MTALAIFAGIERISTTVPAALTALTALSGWASGDSAACARRKEAPARDALQEPATATSAAKMARRAPYAETPNTSTTAPATQPVRLGGPSDAATSGGGVSNKASHAASQGPITATSAPKTARRAPSAETPSISATMARAMPTAHPALCPLGTATTAGGAWRRPHAAPGCKPAARPATLTAQRASGAG